MPRKTTSGTCWWPVRMGPVHPDDTNGPLTGDHWMGKTMNPWLGSVLWPIREVLIHIANDLSVLSGWSEGSPSLSRQPMKGLPGKVLHPDRYTFPSVPHPGSRNRQSHPDGSKFLQLPAWKAWLPDELLIFGAPWAFWVLASSLVPVYFPQLAFLILTRP